MKLNKFPEYQESKLSKESINKLRHNKTFVRARRRRILNSIAMNTMKNVPSSQILPDNNEPAPSIWKKLQFIVFAHFSEIVYQSPSQYGRPQIIDMAEGLRVKNIHKRFEKWRKKVTPEHEMISGQILEFRLILPLLKTIQSELIIASVLKTFHEILNYAIPYLSMFIVKDIRKNMGISVLNTGLVILVFLVNILLGILEENSSFYTAKAKAMTDQILKGIVYKKLRASNYRFLHHAETSFITQLIFHETEQISNFVAILPICVASPFSFLASYLIIYNEISYLVWLPSTIFVFMMYLTIFIKLMNVKKRHIYSSMSSKRAHILDKLIPNIKIVKLFSMENVFDKVLNRIRKNEISALSSIHLNDALINFMEIMMPIIGAASSIAYFNVSTGQVLSVERTYTIVSVLAISAVPFKSISIGFDRFGYFKDYMNAFTLFLDKIVERDDYNGGNYSNDEFITRKLNVNQVAPNDMVLWSLPSGDNTPSDKHLDKRMDEQQMNHFFVRKIYKKGLNQSRSDINIKLKDCNFYVDFTSDKEVLKLFFSKKFDIGKTEELDLADDLIDTDNSNSKQVRLTQVLFDISLQAQRGEAICILGRPDSGKSTLLFSLMNETILGNGDMQINGTINYLSFKYQGIIKGSIRDNILLGSRFEKKRYTDALLMIQFDIARFAGDDHFELLEDATNIGDSEKRKLLLARVIYNKSDILLIDEFFDDVQIDHRSRLFKTVVKEAYKDRIVVYITKDPSLFRFCQKGVVLDNGKIVETGTYKNLIKQKGSLFYHLATKGNLDADQNPDEWRFEMQARQEHLADISLDDSLASDELDDRVVPLGRNIIPIKKPVQKKIENKQEWAFNQLSVTKNEADSTQGSEKKNIIDEVSLRKVHKSLYPIIKDTEDEATVLENINKVIWLLAKKTRGSIVEKNEIHTNKNIWPPLKEIFLHCNILLKVIIVTLFIVNSFALLLDDIWLGVWSSGVIELESNFEYLKIYLYISIMTAISVFFLDLLFMHFTRQGLMKVYHEAIRKLLKSETELFSRIPPSRIAYRLTKDLQTIDTDLVTSVNSLVKALFATIGGICILLYTTFGIYAIIFLVGGYFLINHIKQASNISMIFWNNTSFLKTDLFAIVKDLLKNILTLRNMGKAELYENRYYEESDRFQNSASHFGNFIFRWLNIRVAIYTSFQILGVFLFVLIAVEIAPEYYSSKLWVLSFAMAWIYKFKRSVHEFSNSIVIGRSQLISYFRLKEYDKYARKTKGTKSFKFDHSKMAIELKNISFSYNTEIQILDRIDFKVKSGERVGVIGRPGAGKHTIIYLIFKLYERMKVQDPSEEIFKIFGQNIDEINPLELRKHLFILFANPKVFFGSVSHNIDPNDSHKKEDIMKALHFLKIMEYKKVCHIEDLLNGAKIRDDTNNDIEEIEELGKLSNIYTFDSNDDNESEYFSIDLKRNGMAENRRNKLIITPHQSDIAEGSFTPKVGSVKQIRGKKILTIGHSKRASILKEAGSGISNPHLILSRNEQRKNTVNLIKSNRNILNEMKSKMTENHNESVQIREQKSLKINYNEYKNYILPSEDESYLRSLLKSKVDQESQKSLIRLIMITRAFLQKPKILFLEEDAFDFQMIESDYYYDIFWDLFPRMTILSILNGCDNIMRYDRIVVIDGGKVIESAPPGELLQNSSSWLHKYVSEVEPGIISKLDGDKDKLLTSFQQNRNVKLKEKKKEKIDSLLRLEKLLEEIELNVSQVISPTENQNPFSMFNLN